MSLAPDLAPHLQQEVLDVARALIRVDTSNLPGNETPAAALVRDVLAGAGVDAQLVARDPDRANVVARIPGTGDGPSLAFVGHLDVVPADARDWTHPPFEGVVDDDGYLHGRGAVDMKGEVAVRTVALAQLAREGFRPRGDLWLVMVADEEDGRAHVGMSWLRTAMPEIRCDYSVNEGGGARVELADGRAVYGVSVGEKGTLPVRVTALGEAGHASIPTIGANAVPRLARLLARIGDGVPAPALPDSTRPFFESLLGHRPGWDDDPAQAVTRAAALHPTLRHVVPALTGTTMAPTGLQAGVRLNVMPARASMDLDCRVLPGVTAADVEADLRARLGDDLPYDLEWLDEHIPGSASPASSPLMDAVAGWVAEHDPEAGVLPEIVTGFTDSAYLRESFGTVAYGFSPYPVTPALVLDEGLHNRDERVHVDDLSHGVGFHLDLARRLLGPAT